MTAPSEDNDLMKPKMISNCFDNPWNTWTGVPATKPFQLLKFVTWDKCYGDHSQIPQSKKDLDETLPIKHSESIKNEFKESPDTGIRTMWIGHSTVLVQFDGLTILTDPIFSDRCGPSFLSPKRYRQPPYTIEELPKVDVVVISHNHYDHLDSESVKKLQRQFEDLTWYVPLKLKEWMTGHGCKNVYEMNWLDEKTEHLNKEVKVVCLPCQHWSLRYGYDTNWTLWCSWAVIGPKHRFYFGGDTGYCPVFKKIGEKYGKFSLAAIPIGAYEPRDFMKTQHVNYEDAVQIHMDIKAERSLGIHWGTFKLTYEPVVHNWFIKGCALCCPVCGKVHIKDTLLLTEKSSLCGICGFPLKRCVKMTTCIKKPGCYSRRLSRVQFMVLSIHRIQDRQKGGGTVTLIETSDFPLAQLDWSVGDGQLLFEFFKVAMSGFCKYLTI